MSTKIYVGNLSFNILQDSLKETFSQYGDVSSCKVIVDRETGRSKGFGFIEMGSSEDAKTAISALDGAELDGRSMRVNEAKPQERNERSRW